MWTGFGVLTWQRVPLVPVGDALLERPAVAAVTLVHGGVVVGVHLGEVDEHVVVRGDAGLADQLAAWRDGHTGDEQPVSNELQTRSVR